MKKTVVIFSGAGLSAESGIPTFRDSNGLWENHKVQDVATHDGWQRNPQLVLDFYAARLAASQNTEPNEAHRSIARLEEKYNVVNFTQNVDNLLERAGCTNVRHVHGTLFRRKCQNHWDVPSRPEDKFSCNYKADHVEAVKLGEECPKCQGQLRPDVVWFGESVEMGYEEIHRLIKNCKNNDGTFICVGTSAQVYPAATLVDSFYGLRNKYIVDLNPQPNGNYTLLTGKASEQIKLLADRLLDAI